MQGNVKVRELLIKTNGKDEFFTEEGCFILEIWNAPEDEEVSIARARVRPGITTVFHRLKGTVERYVIMEGTGLVEVGDLPPTEVVPGDVVIIPRNTPQRITNTGDGDLIFLCICTPRFVPEEYETMGNLPQ
ncbi:MAG TPA: cupin domain-containing protein [Syntrophus sp. (in: bacteria)]|nr:cupin domain-containing protein [Syntrophus sp. (in: bacteria)]